LPGDVDDDPLPAHAGILMGPEALSRMMRVSAGRRAGGLKAVMSKNSLLRMALRKAQNRFLLVNLVTKRIRQLKEGARPLIQVGNNLSVEETALQEIAEGQITPRNIADS
jgi:DNA-directed RNA polymerase subunit K/omega